VKAAWYCVLSLDRAPMLVGWNLSP
jgi:hypothetical protein